MRGLVFEYAPEGLDDIARLGGTSVGATRFDRDAGEWFDGSHYTTLKLSFQPVNSGFYSCVVEFTPAFEAVTAPTYCLFNSNGTSPFTLLKYATAGGSNAISFSYGASNQTIALASYQPYWRTNQRNVLVFTNRTGAQAAYLNGVLVDTETDAYVPFDLDAPLYVGSTAAGTSKFSGFIKSIKFFKHSAASELLTAGEAVDYTNRSTFRYRERAVVDLPLGAAQHDAVNLKTLDASPNGQHFTWTAGATAPTKLSTVGYSADGGDTFSSATIIANSTYTVALVMRHSSATGYMADWRGGGGTGYIRLGSAVLLQVSSGTAYVNGKPSTVLAPGNFNVIMVTGIAINGPAGTKLLADNAGATGITGSIHGYAVWPGTLTMLQVKDHWVQSMAELNKV